MKKHQAVFSFRDIQQIKNQSQSFYFEMIGILIIFAMFPKIGFSVQNRGNLIQKTCAIYKEFPIYNQSIETQSVTFVIASLPALLRLFPQSQAQDICEDFPDLFL